MELILKRMSMMKSSPTLFEDYKIKRVYDEATETWLFSVVDVIQALIQQPDFQTTHNNESIRRLAL
jgi:DNA-damage-inducible protein D